MADASVPSRHPRITVAGVLAAFAGLALFWYMLHQTGADPILDGFRRLGLAFLAILLLGGLRFVARALAWTLCHDDTPPLRLSQAFPALVTGDSLGNLTPLGLFLSEPAKAAYVRPRVTLISALSSITVENLFYTLTVAIVIVSGTIALLFAFDVPRPLQQASWLGLVAVAGVVGAAWVVLARQITVVSGLVAWLDRRRPGPAGLRPRLEKLQSLEQRVFGFAKRSPGRMLPILALELAFHVLGVIEVYLTLYFLTGERAPTLLTAFILESVNRTITVVFKFVPLRLGVDEVGTELLTRTLGLPAGIGVTMALVRKARILSWTAIGVTMLVARGVFWREQRADG
jgi:hypothetical protein